MWHLFARDFLRLGEEIRARRAHGCGFCFAILDDMPTAAKKIFIVDAMAHIYRAFYARRKCRFYFLIFCGD
jgi:hypothetical protein